MTASIPPHPSPSKTPIACLLSERDLAARSEEIKQTLLSAVEATEELPDGVAFRFPGDDHSLSRIVEFVAAERRCCPFFTFEIVVTPGGDAIWLKLRGSAEIKAFIQAQFGVGQASE